MRRSILLIPLAPFSKGGRGFATPGGVALQKKITTEELDFSLLDIGTYLEFEFSDFILCVANF